MVEDIKKNFNNSLKEIQENSAKQVEDLKEEAQKSLKELQENMTKQVIELNKKIQDLKREVDTVKKKPKWGNAADRNPRKEILNHRCEHQQQNTRDGRENLGAEDSIENIGTTIKEKAKCKKMLSQNIQNIQDTMRRPNLQIIWVDENEDFQL